MKVKWKCLIKNVIIPFFIVVVILIALIIVIPIICNYIYDNTQLLMQEPHINFTQSQQPILQPIPRYEFIYPYPLFLLLFAIALIGLFYGCIKESIKPCVIKENTVTDFMAHSISTFFDFVRFMTCLLLLTIGVLCVICGFLISLIFFLYALIIIFTGYFIGPWNDS